MFLGVALCGVFLLIDGVCILACSALGGFPAAGDLAFCWTLDPGVVPGVPGRGCNRVTTTTQLLRAIAFKKIQVGGRLF